MEAKRKNHLQEVDCMRSQPQQARLLPEFSIKEMEAEAVQFLRDKCGQSSHIGLGFSGGKDSVVVMELARRADLAVNAFYHATCIDPPEITKFIRKLHPSVQFLYPKEKFFKKIQTFAPPLPGARWCCRILKHGKKRTRQYSPLILGIRAEESARRHGYGRVASVRKNQTLIYPIFQWTAADVWEYIEWRKLPYCELYDEGFDRLGCVPCPFKAPHMHRISKERWPGIYRAFENAVKKWFWDRAWQGRTMYNDSPEDFLKAWYLHKALWYKPQTSFEWQDQQVKFMKHWMRMNEATTSVAGLE